MLQFQRPENSAREEVTIRQKPRITVDTTPGPSNKIQTQTFGKVSGYTVRPDDRDSIQTNPPATTYRPAIQFFTQKTSPKAFPESPQLFFDNKQFDPTEKREDFATEFQKFQQDIVTTSTITPLPRLTNLETYQPQTKIQRIELPSAAPNSIFETQLLFDPATGLIDSSLFSQNVAYRIPTTIISSQQQQHQQQQQQHQYNTSPQTVHLEQLQQQSVNQRPSQTYTTRSSLQLPQFSQQVISIIFNNKSFNSRS